ncbi:acylphosphatase [Streptococcaceae bacterium ESL0687]|nr:acylphosphatase [Streptococcaceae bacterium ESL0687]
MIKLRFIVSGRVQGVGFRWSTQSLARELGIKGQVWNNDDGSVEILAQADSASKLLLFEKKLREGVNSLARVDYLEKTPADFKSFKDFNVRL